MVIQGAVSRVAAMLGRESLIVRSLRPLYEQSLAVLSARRGIRWSINGVPFRIDPRQRRRVSRVYDAPVARWLSERIKPGDLCVNVGANIGVYALQCATWSAPHGRVVVFEPNPHARTILERHLDYNNLKDRVQVVAAAVGDTVGTSTFFADPTGDGMSRLGAPNRLLSGSVEITVPTVTLDGFFAEAPDWLVIDVEGFEIQVLRGAQRIINRCRGIIVEVHPNDWSVAGTTRDDFQQLLRECALRVTPLSNQDDPFSIYGHIALEKA